MKIKHVIPFRELVEAKMNPYQSVAHPWNYLLLSEDGRYGFSMNQEKPTAWVGTPCEDKNCSNGWHTEGCIKSYRAKMAQN